MKFVKLKFCFPVLCYVLWFILTLFLLYAGVMQIICKCQCYFLFRIILNFCEWISTKLNLEIVLKFRNYGV